MNKAIAFGADNAYIDKVTTTIKSICAHNDNITFYLLNDDVPSEWFRIMNHRLKTINSKIVNVKITEHPLKEYSVPDAQRLNYAAFFRYFIPHYIHDSRVLYLDSDTLVTGNLDELFTTDLEGLPLAAIQDYSSWGWLTIFNSGVMLIDTDKWREENVLQNLIELTNEHHEHVYGDQGVLNMYFQNRWKHLDKKYNYMVGLDSIVHSVVDGDQNWYDQSIENKNPHTYMPKIIHYTAGKPWQALNANRYKDVWWFYHSLDWSDILLRSYALKGGYESVVDKEKFQTCIFTNAAEMAHLEYLIKALPEVHFNILAPTNFAASVMDLQSYLNVSLFPSYNPFVSREVLDKIDFYLDINYFSEVDDIVNTVHSMNKPVLTFKITNHDKTGQSIIFDDSHPEQMVNHIKQLYIKDNSK